MFTWMAKKVLRSRSSIVQIGGQAISKMLSGVLEREFIKKEIELNGYPPTRSEIAKVFGFKSGSYGETRIYGFLAERYLSYWFNKYTKPLVWPIVFHDIDSIS